MRMADAMASQGHAITLAALDWEGPGRAAQEPRDYYGVSNDFELVQLPYTPPRGSRLRYLHSAWQLYRQCKKLIRATEPDLVYGRNLMGCLASAKCGIPTVYESHMPVWQGRLESVLFARLVASPHFRRLVVISERLRKMYLERGILSESAITVAHDAADIYDDAPPTEPWPGRRSALQVGYTGSLFPGRGISIVMEMANRMPEVDFHLIGGLRKDLENWQSKPTPVNVHFHGYIAPAEVVRYRAACDVLLAPYQRRVTIDGTGNTVDYMSPLKIFEYMSSRRAIIASDLPVLREILSDDSAVLVAPDTPQEWIRALESLKDAPKRQQLADRAYEDFTREYTWQKRAHNVLDGL